MNIILLKQYVCWSGSELYNYLFYKFLSVMFLLLIFTFCFMFSGTKNLKIVEKHWRMRQICKFGLRRYSKIPDRFFFEINNISVVLTLIVVIDILNL